MKKIFLIAAILIASLCAGCDSEADKARINADAVKSPEFIAQMPDGRNLYCVRIENYYDSSHYHFIYYFGTNDTKTVSVNYSVPAGKSSYNQTIVIDGQTYKLEKVN